MEVDSKKQKEDQYPKITKLVPKVVRESYPTPTLFFSSTNFPNIT